MTEAHSFNHHIRFTVGGMTSMEFVSLPAEESAEFYWTNDDGQNWHYHNSIFPWLIREAGDYIISFPGKHYTPSFGSGVGNFAREFHSVEFTGDYHPEDTSFSGMFDGCESLTSIDLGPLALDTSAVTNMSDMFRSPIWDVTSVYQMGDVVINNGLVYVASMQAPSSEPGVYCDGWSLVEGAGTTDTIEGPEPIPIEVKESIAGIIRDTNDIPE